MVLDFCRHDKNIIFVKKYNMLYSIYLIKCPKTLQVMYVGASKNLKERFIKHLSEKTNKLKYEWVLDLKKNGYYPLFEVIKSGLSKYDAEIEEIKYIEILKPKFNIEKGGFTPPNRKGIKLSVEEKIQRFKNSTLKKEVYQIDLNNNIIDLFEGVRDASRKTGIDHRSIAQVAAGSIIRKTAGGYKWKYKDI